MVAIETDTRYIVEPFQCWRTYYPKPCGVVSKDRYHTDSIAQEQVTSYRGEMQYLQVGNKRRKVFHPFEVWRVSKTPLKQTGYVCVPPNKWGENFMIVNWYNQIPTWPNTSSALYSGDCCPFVKKDSSTAFGDELRKFVVRDLFIKANAPDFDGAVFLAELDETLLELKRILSGALRGLFATRKNRNPKTQFSLKPDEWWLWYRYFLLPAMMDAEDLIALFQKRQQIDRVQDGDRSDGYQAMSGSGDLDLGWAQPWTCLWQSKYKYGLGGAIDMHTRFDPARFGTSAHDVVRAVWERIPWSFVFDWFVNVGDWLASLREIEIDYAQSYATFAIEAETKVSFPEWTMDVEKVTFKTFHMSRIVDLEPPTFPLVDRRWRNITRTIDLISLTIGTLRNVLTRR